MAVEKELLQALEMISQGREEGFNILYSHTYNYVYNRAKFIMKDEEDALDLTQETFIQAYKGIHSLEDANNVYAWLGGIVYRQGMRIFRKKRELLVSDDGEYIFEEVISHDMDANPEDAAQQKATSEIVMGMIEELPELQKSAVLAFYYDNMKIDDIAKACECSSNTIKSRLNYAKKYLKEKVEAHEKANRYKLCSLSPAVLFLACKSLFATEKYTLAKASAQTIYTASCSALGLSAGTLTLAGTGGAAIAGEGATATASTIGAAASAGATTGAGMAAGTLATKAGLSIGAKIATAVAALGTAGAVGAGALFLSNTGEEKEPGRIEETQDTLAADEQISNVDAPTVDTPAVSTPEIDVPTEDNPSEPEISFVDYAMDWKDANLEAAMREFLGIYDRDIMYSDVKDLTYLSLSDKSISDISALGCLTGLERLNLSENNISDISALANLTKLTSINLSKNYAITDISVLSNFTNLSEICINDNQITDIEPLANLTNVYVMTMGNNSIQDISPLANMTNLTLLGMQNNNVTDISPLANLTNLQHLLISNNQITDLSPLANLTNLQRIEAWNNNITDYSPISFVPDKSY